MRNVYAHCRRSAAAGQQQFSRMSDPRPYYRGLLLPAVFLLAAAAALLADLPVAATLQQLKHDARHAERPARTCVAYLGYLDTFELFGHGLGVVLVVIMLHQLDPGRRWAIPRVLACALAAGVAADLLKMTVMRCRPVRPAFPFPGSVWETFGQWWPLPERRQRIAELPLRPHRHGRRAGRRLDLALPPRPPPVYVAGGAGGLPAGGRRGRTTPATCWWAPPSVAWWRPCC